MCSKLCRLRATCQPKLAQELLAAGKHQKQVSAAGPSRELARLSRCLTEFRHSAAAHSCRSGEFAVCLRMECLSWPGPARPGKRRWLEVHGEQYRREARDGSGVLRSLAA